MIWRAFLFIPAVGAGIAAFIWLNSADEIVLGARDPQPTPVRVVTLAPAEVAGRAEGFGRVRSVRRWEGVAQVDGRILTMVDNLAEGAFLDGGSVYARIDPRDYEIAKAKAEASVASAEASLAEIEALDEAARATLALERDVVALAEADLNRKRRLVESGTSAQITRDQSERDLLAQRRKVVELENQLALYAVQRVTAEAAIATSEVELEEAERNLAETVFLVPFDGRVASANIEVGEYVRVGDVLLELDDTAASEVTAEVQPSALRAMFKIASGGVRRGVPFSDTEAIGAVMDRLDLTATVVQEMGEERTEWSATVVRTDGSVDETTGTVGVVVRVFDPFGRAMDGPNAPLSNGTFVRVIFSTRVTGGLIAVPREAIRRRTGGSRFVFVMEANNTLGERAVSVAAPINGRVVVTDGLAAGDRVLLSAPQPPVLGMPLTAVEEWPAEVALR